MSTQDDFVAEAKAQLDKWNAEIKELQAEADQMGTEAQAHLKAQMEMMEAQRAEAAAQLEKLGKANTAAWQDVQAGWQGAWKAMEKGMEDARKRYMKD